MTVANRRGMTLVEMLIAVVVFGMVFISAMVFLDQQGHAFKSGTTRMNALQNFRFAADLVERNLRIVGSGTTDGQPFLVYAGENVVVFNADHTSNSGVSLDAYHDKDAPAAATMVLPKERRFKLPESSFMYPEISFSGEAETISLFLRPDSSTARTDDYALFRQTNDLAPELVSRNILRTGSSSFFEYLRMVENRIETVPVESLPFAHHQASHNPAEAVTSPIDRLRGVRVNLTVTNGKQGAEERTTSMTRLIRMPNAGLAPTRTCGGPPLNTELEAQVDMLPSGRPVVQLTWDPSPDDTGGQEDVRFYVLYRRRAPTAEWETFHSVASGTYEHLDTNVQSGDRWYYGIRTQDCSPKLSAGEPFGTPRIDIP